MLNMDGLTPKSSSSGSYAEASELIAPEVTQQNFQEPAISSVSSSGQDSNRITLSQLVNLCIEKGASDIHFREGGRVSLRVGGKMIFIENIDALTKEETMDMVKDLVQDEGGLKQLQSNKEIDFSYTHTNGVNFRVNLFFQKGRIAGVMRMISKHIPSMGELGIPDVVKNVLDNREGLIIVCGTAGSGKSTSVQSMVEYINSNFVKHIITIENPIEYVFEDKKSMITQREIGKDTLTMETALKSALREDANIVMVSEINDCHTLEGVLDLVETGHLVIATMLTRDVPQTVERLVSYCSSDIRARMQDRLSEDLISVIAQDLVPRKDQPGLIAIFELMFSNQTIKQIIKRGNFPQLREAIQAGAEDGMIKMDTYAYELAKQGIIEGTHIAEYSHEEER